MKKYIGYIVNATLLLFIIAGLYFRKELYALSYIITLAHGMVTGVYVHGSILIFEDWFVNRKK